MGHTFKKVNSSAENRTQMTRLTAGDNDLYMTEDWSGLGDSNT
jgi:hypothetical protein